MSNNEEQPEPLKIFVSENVKVEAVGPGMQTPTAKEQEEKLPPEEVEKRQKIMLEYTRLLGRYCPPHNKQSRWVKPSDVLKVEADGKDLVAMCRLPRGAYGGIAALAHSQIDDKDPLRFFVLPNGMVIINPVITNHTKVPVYKEEGCMSFPDTPILSMVPRYNKVNVTYQTLAKEKDDSEPVLSKSISENVNGSIAHVFQHECGHLNGCNIYDPDFAIDKSVGFGDGKEVDPSIWEVENSTEEIKS